MFIAEVFFIGVQGAAVSLLRQIGGLIRRDEGRIGCPDAVTFCNSMAEILDGGPVFRSCHIQFVQ